MIVVVSDLMKILIILSNFMLVNIKVLIGSFY